MRLNAMAFAATTFLAGLMAASPALSADASALPAEEVQGSVRYITGGVGEDAIAAYATVARDLPPDEDTGQGSSGDRRLQASGLSKAFA